MLDYLRRMAAHRLFYTGRLGTTAKSRSRRMALERLEIRNLLTAAPGPVEAGNLLSGGLCACPICTGQGLSVQSSELTSVSQYGSGGSEPVAAMPALSSNPNATAKLFLDFDGDFQSTWGAWSNVNTPSFDRDGNTSTFSTSEISIIQEIWSRVAEDYAPFNIDVTTIAPGSLANKVVAHIAIGGSGSWYASGTGGVAYIGGFYNSASNVGYVFEDNLNSAKSIADACSHEAGHLFGLQHQSAYSGTSKTKEYYSGTSAWAPLMGNSYSATRSTWHYGTSSVSSISFQDDIAILSNSSNGFGLKADDFGSTFAAASQLAANASSVNFAGLLGHHSDQDVWKFTTGGGSVSFALSGEQYGTNLDAILEIRDSSGTLIVIADSSTSLSASISTTLLSGTFYVIARSNGTYGNMGQYRLTGTLPTNQVPSVSLTNMVTSLPEDTNTASDIRIADIVVSDDGIGMNTLRLSGLHADQLIIRSGSLYLRSGTTLDFETLSRLDFAVEVDDDTVGATPDDTATHAISITDVNERPTDILLSHSSIAENQGSGTTIGTLRGVDPDADDSGTYEFLSGLGDTDNGSFMLTSAGVLKTAISFDFEGQSSYSIRIKLMDAGGLSTEKIFAISILNINEVPVDVLLSNNKVAENQASGAPVGTFSVIDPDAGDASTYLLVAGDGADDNESFEVVDSQLRTRASFDFETKNGYSIRIRATDQDSLFAERTFFMSVTDTHEAPSAVNLSGSSIAENMPAGSTVGVFSSIDQDTDSAATYSFVSSTDGVDNGFFEIVDDQLLTKASFNFEGKNTYFVGVRGTDPDGLFAEQTFLISVTNGNDAPWLNPNVQPPLDVIREDSRASLGTPVWKLLGGVKDSDAGALRGIAISGAQTSHGNWQFTLDGGVNWQQLDGVSSSLARLLPADGSKSRIRFVPNPDYQGTATINYQAWDQTQGAAGGTFDISASSSVGGTTAFSANWRTSAIAVTPVNDAPVMIVSPSPSLDAIAEDDRTSFGTPIWKLLGGVTDVDVGDRRGIAITTAQTAHGHWQFTLDKGIHWQPLEGVTSSLARLLPANGGNSRIRFVPDQDFQGTANIGYRAWDQTQGAAGGRFDISAKSSLGGATAFSATWRTSSVAVTPVHDAPAIGNADGTIGYTLNTAPIALASAAALTGVDSSNFNGGFLLLRIVGGADYGNRVSLGGAFSFAQVGDTWRVMHGSRPIGDRLADGFGTRDLRIGFNANATQDVVQQLVRSITFRTVNSMSAASRKVTLMVNDGHANGTSREVSRTVSVSL